MFLRMINMRPILSTLCIEKYDIRLIHLTSNYFVRKLVSSKNFETEYLEENVIPVPSQQILNKNFLGIESDEGVIIIDSHKSSDYGIKSSVTKVMPSKEKFYKASYGIIRHDMDNKLRFHGQYENKIDSDFPHKSSKESDVFEYRNTVKLKSFNSLNQLNINLKDNSNFIPPNKSEISSHNLHIDTICSNNEIQSKDNNLKESHGMGYIDECFFGNIDEKDSSNKNSTAAKENTVEELSFIDENIFGTDISNNSSCKNEQSMYEDITTMNESDKCSYIDKAFFGNNIPKICSSQNEQIIVENNIRTIKQRENISEDMNSKSTIKHDASTNEIKANSYVEIENIYVNSFQKSSSANFNNTLFNHQSNDHLPLNDITQMDVTVNKHVTQYYNEGNDKIQFQTSFKTKPKHINAKEISLSEKTLSSKLFTFDKSKDCDQMSTAKDFVSKLRSERVVQKQTVKRVGALNIELKDSKGFRILKNQVPDLSHVTRDEIITMLKNNILYSDENLMILNKPYNLVIHDSETTSSPCLSQLLDDFAKITNPQNADSKLYTVHRLDKETTGCLLLARNEMAADKLKYLFSQRKIIKKYWIVTSRVPDPLKGVINIPIAEGSVHNKKRMVLHPQIPKDIDYRSHSKNGKQAMTAYQVISISGNAALVEVVPETGLKHQIRVHFGFGLSCPILGDHKYSHLDKMAPQKLSSDLLQRLHVRQTKVRYIPMHLHAHSVTIPSYLDDRDLFVTAPLPYHMTANLKRLKFKKKNKLNL